MSQQKKICFSTLTNFSCIYVAFSDVTPHLKNCFVEVILINFGLGNPPYLMCFKHLLLFDAAVFKMEQCN